MHQNSRLTQNYEKGCYEDSCWRFLAHRALAASRAISDLSSGVIFAVAGLSVLTLPKLPQFYGGWFFFRPRSDPSLAGKATHREPFWMLRLSDLGFTAGCTNLNICRAGSNLGHMDGGTIGAGVDRGEVM